MEEGILVVAEAEEETDSTQAKVEAKVEAEEKSRRRGGRQTWAAYVELEPEADIGHGGRSGSGSGSGSGHGQHVEPELEAESGCRSLKMHVGGRQQTESVKGRWGCAARATAKVEANMKAVAVEVHWQRRGNCQSYRAVSCDLHHLPMAYLKTLDSGVMMKLSVCNT
ncbi:hypothetical protein CBR_g37946 [Chara braunii]|uniref:Uncharacterized protein n=1 Tax=Chara braunii TaxID=69332 RepID=A0A388LP69_CHABU|nr:hypothetical protein CBR_g37946 [Chara braunii]|eukprot:GBG84071.1 hypothetical protein CBR_g37946 [Chara braunii]